MLLLLLLLKEGESIGKSGIGDEDM